VGYRMVLYPPMDHTPQQTRAVWLILILITDLNAG